MATRKGSNKHKVQWWKEQGSDVYTEVEERNQDELNQPTNILNHILSNQPQGIPIILHSTHFPIPNSDTTQSISEGISRLRRAQVDLYMDKCSIEINGKGTIEMEWDPREKVMGYYGLEDIESAQQNTRLSQVQLFQYLLYQYNQQKQLEITLNIQDYFELRGITRRKENIDRFYQDLIILSCISIDLIGKNKGCSDRMIGRLLRVKGLLATGGEKIDCKEKGKKIGKVIVELGEWAKKLKLTQFVLLPKVFFTYAVPNQNPTILLSLKFNQLCRVNSAKSRETQFKKVAIKSLLETLGVSENDVAKQGCQYYQRLFEKSFETLKREGYAINFDKNASETGKEFLNNIVFYQNDSLESIYRNSKTQLFTDKK